MTRVHDMGGRWGDGAVDPGGADDPVFAEDWHARALALTLAAGGLGQWNLDASRHARELLGSKDYTRFSYFEKWTAALADLLVTRGVLDKGELASGHATGSSPLSDRVLKANAVAQVLARGGPADRKTDTSPAFHPGDPVRTRRPARNRLVDGGHTRQPAYTAGAVGRVMRHHGAHVLPDSNAHFLGEAPEHLYSVAFRAEDLWGEAEAPGDEVMVDMWQSYLEPI